MQDPNPAAFEHVRHSLELLQQRDDETTHSFASQMHRFGIAVVTVSDAQWASFAACAAEARRFFAETPGAVKEEGKMAQDHDWGYVLMPDVKEFWQMRKGAQNPFPVHGNLFFDVCTDVAETCLAALARGLHVDERKLVQDLVDARDVNLSSSIFRFFHYLAGTQ